jgi:hypothetical protein
MRNLKKPSKQRHRIAPLTPEQRYEGEKNLAILLIIAHDHGVDAAMKEWDRMAAEIDRRKAQSLPPAPSTSSAAKKTTPRPSAPPKSA